MHGVVFSCFSVVLSFAEVVRKLRKLSAYRSMWCVDRLLAIHLRGDEIWKFRFDFILERI